MALRLQEWIHRLEVGPGYRFLSYGVALIAFVALAVFYDLALYRNLSTMEGMDAAQVARNLADGKGYTTYFIRPLSLYLLEKVQKKVSETTSPALGIRMTASDFLDGNHPDLANAPAYPVLLASLLRFMPSNHPDVTAKKKFQIYLPDLWITGLNQFLLLLVVILVFALGRSLFDLSVAWVAASVVAGTEMFWRLSNSGLPTVFLMLIFFCLLGSLSRLGLRPGVAGAKDRKALAWAALGGLSMGLSALERYSLGL